MRPGDRIGPYTVVGVLGRGGMGVVYEVRHPDVPRRLALKLIDPAGADDEGLARFQREGEALARVRHPGVVGVHAVGRTERGAPYLVMDLVEGAPLPAEAVAPRRAAAIVRDLADAVAALHRAGVVHRDLKPSNVMLAPDGRPVLLDLGLARTLDEKRLTLTGTILGTPAFMSPEQAQGLPADARTDVYGLGAVLYALLTGRPPFSEGHGGAYGVLLAVIQRDPPWPGDLVPGVPPALDALVRRALAKAPAARPPSAEALRDALDAFLAGNDAGAARPARSLVASVAALAVVGAVGLAASQGRAPAPPPAPAGADAPPPPAAGSPAGGEAPPRSTARPELGSALAVGFIHDDLLVLLRDGGKGLARWRIDPQGQLVQEDRSVPVRGDVGDVMGVRAWGVPRVVLRVDGRLMVVEFEPRPDRPAKEPLWPFAHFRGITAVAAGPATWSAAGEDGHVLLFRDAEYRRMLPVPGEVVALEVVTSDQVLALTAAGGDQVHLTDCRPDVRPTTLLEVRGRSPALAAPRERDDPRGEAEAFAVAVERDGAGHVYVGARSTDGGWTLVGPDGPAHARGPVVVRFVGGGERLVSVAPGELRVWHAPSGEVVRTLQHDDHAPRSIDASPDGRWLVVACEDGDVHLWDLAALDLPEPTAPASSSDEAPATSGAVEPILTLPDACAPGTPTGARFVGSDHVLVQGAGALVLWALEGDRPSVVAREDAPTEGALAMARADHDEVRGVVDDGRRVFELTVRRRPAPLVTTRRLVERAADGGASAVGPRAPELLVALGGVVGGQVQVRAGDVRVELEGLEGGELVMTFAGAEHLVAVDRASRNVGVWRLSSPRRRWSFDVPAGWTARAIDGGATQHLLAAPILVERDGARALLRLGAFLRSEGVFGGVTQLGGVQGAASAPPGVVCTPGGDAVAWLVGGRAPFAPWIADAPGSLPVVGPGHELVSLDCSPAGDRLVAACAAGDVHVWRTADLRPPR